MNESLYKTQELKLINRNMLNLSGVKQIKNFDNEEFELISVLGDVYIKGKNLEVVLLDTDKGDVKIKGKINSISYVDSKKENKESLFTKLFKWLVLIYSCPHGVFWLF